MASTAKNKTGQGSMAPKVGGKQPKTTEQGNSCTQQVELPCPQENHLSDTVYLEPCDYEKPIIRHPVGVGKALTAKGINTYTEITAVGKFRFKLTFRSAQETKKLVEINMEEQNLKCYLPTILRQTVGLAKGIPKEYSEEELKLNLRSGVQITKVERMKKMDRNMKLNDTENVKITFTGKELPDSVSLYGCSFKIVLYLFPVKQCQNCWAFGHRKEKCWRTTKCKDCGEEQGTARKKTTARKKHVSTAEVRIILRTTGAPKRKNRYE